MQCVAVDALEPRSDWYRHLEEGRVLFFPKTPFDVAESHRETLRKTAQVAGAHHKNIAYRPAQNRVTGFEKAADSEALRDALRSYSQNALRFLGEFVPRYMQKARVDFASFRPQEEEGRDLPTNKRNDLLHVDAFPSRPTRGDLILRIFTNINPEKSRVWMVSDAFGEAARQHAEAAGLAGIASSSESPLARLRAGVAPALAAMGIGAANRSPYDRFMLGFHDYLKHSADYQRDCPKYRLEFPPDSTWMCFTDVVPHAVLSGRYALEQTVIVSRESLLDRRNAPVEILQKICGRPLVATS
ncbi:MAG: Kdo hydroxylase family protein [Acidobacteriota bacterium]|nr:Kdo hydroxylase family protein [Acidobacteriota bacterium]